MVNWKRPSLISLQMAEMIAADLTSLPRETWPCKGYSRCPGLRGPSFEGGAKHQPGQNSNASQIVASILHLKTQRTFGVPCRFAQSDAQAQDFDPRSQEPECFTDIGKPLKVTRQQPRQKGCCNYFEGSINPHYNFSFFSQFFCRLLSMPSLPSASAHSIPLASPSIPLPQQRGGNIYPAHEY